MDHYSGEHVDMISHLWLAQPYRCDTFGSSSYATNTLAFHGAGGIITGSADHKCRYYRQLAGYGDFALVSEMDMGIGNIHSVQSLTDRHALCAGYAAPYLQVWNGSTGSLTPWLGHTGQVLATEYSPSMGVVASVSGDRSLLLWSYALTADDELVGKLRTAVDPSGGSPGQCLAFGSAHLFSGSADRTVKCWDVATGQQLHCWGGHRSEIKSIAAASDSNMLLSGSEDGELRIWDTRCATLALTLNPKAGRIRAICANECFVCIGTTQPAIQFWDYRFGKNSGCLKGHKSYLSDLKMDNHARLLISCGLDGRSNAWQFGVSEEETNVQVAADDGIEMGMGEDTDLQQRHHSRKRRRGGGDELREAGNRRAYREQHPWSVPALSDQYCVLQ